MGSNEPPINPIKHIRGHIRDHIRPSVEIGDEGGGGVTPPVGNFVVDRVVDNVITRAGDNVIIR